MPKSFLFYTSESLPAAQSQPPQPLPAREPLRVLLIGSRRGVMNTIQTLYRLRFAEVREWSPLLPTANAGEVMSILTRYLPTD